MTDRILSIMKYLNLSPSDFADEIGVQRSSISHLVSGRNKPSLEFIQKMLNRFPQLSMEWVLSGTGSMIKDGNIFEPLPETELKLETSVQKPVTDNAKPVINRPIPVKKKSAENDEKQVEKIIYLYKDKTFREYFPE
jgi:transcriptional regulator with XRE-family HTH domain